MIHSALYEYKVFIIFVLLGLLAGAAYGITQFIIFVVKNKLFTHIAEFCFACVLGGGLFLGINFYNFGVFRLYLLVCYLLGFYIERKTIGKLFAKLYALVYNYVVKLLKKFRHSALGVALFK